MGSESPGPGRQSSPVEGDAVDVTPLALGVETERGLVTPLFDRNTPIPASATEVYTTTADGQTALEVHVLTAEREMAADNKSLGRFTIRGIPAAPRGVSRVAVWFDIDHNGILSFSARDMRTGNNLHVAIGPFSFPSDEELERWLREFDEHRVAASAVLKKSFETQDVARRHALGGEEM